MELSVVLPVYNEYETLAGVFRETRQILDEHYKRWELIFVDDGSDDGSYEILQQFHEGDDRVRVIKLATNFGQSAALDAGLKYATGDVIVTMDADGQNDPADIPRLVDGLRQEGYDCLTGWRRDREDPVGKTLASSLAGIFRRIFLDTELHDYGCTLKAFCREAADAVKLQGEMHRYIPPQLIWKGYDVGEIEVNHRERMDGKTKYGWKRIPKGFIDMFNVWFWQKYSGRPLHVFGGLGIITGMAGIFGGLYSVYLKTTHSVSLSDTALPLFAVFMCLLGIQFFMSGILADIGLKNYFSIQRTDEYRVSTILGAKATDENDLEEVGETDLTREPIERFHNGNWEQIRNRNESREREQKRSRGGERDLGRSQGGE